MFSDQFFSDCQKIWDIVGPEALEIARDESDTITNHGAWELVLNCDMLLSRTNGSNEELERMLKTNSYKNVLQHLAREYQLIK